MKPRNRPYARSIFEDAGSWQSVGIGGALGCFRPEQLVGDVLLVTRVDRLARSIGDLQDIVRTLKAKGASLRATEQPIDTSTAAGKCFLDMLHVFHAFETNI